MIFRKAMNREPYINLKRPSLNVFPAFSSDKKTLENPVNNKFKRQFHFNATPTVPAIPRPLTLTLNGSVQNMNTEVLRTDVYLQYNRTDITKIHLSSLS